MTTNAITCILTPATGGDLSLTFGSIYSRVSDYLGTGLSPAGEDLTRAKLYAMDGYRQFLMGIDPRTGRAYQWGFLVPSATLNLLPSSTAGGTMTVTSQTTITDSTTAPFLHEMIGRTVKATASGNEYTIVRYIDATQVVVATDATADDGDDFTIELGTYAEYALPDDFGAMVQDPVFAPRDVSVKLVPRSPGMVRGMYAGAGMQAGYPQYYATYPAPLALGGSAWRMLVWPIPLRAYSMEYRYRVNPSVLTGDSDVPLGGPMMIEAIIASALAMAENRHNERIGEKSAAFKELMAAAIDLDAANRPAISGPMTDSSDLPVFRYNRRPGGVTY